jgi:protein-S-isoprenylcysteine O-methyltransferase Ste14
LAHGHFAGTILFISILTPRDRRPLQENSMQRTYLSLYYLIGYLIPAGLALFVAPTFTLKLLLSKGSYGEVMPRVLGLVLVALGIVVVQIVRLQAYRLYSATLAARAVILVGLIFLHQLSRDPLFLSLLLIVGLGFVLTTASYFLDRRERSS